MLKKITNGRNAEIAAGIIYTVIAIVTVASAWIIDLHRFDLWLSISRYVALRPWTAVMYLLGILLIYVWTVHRKTNIPND